MDIFASQKVREITNSEDFRNFAWRNVRESQIIEYEKKIYSIMRYKKWYQQRENLQIIYAFKVIDCVLIKEYNR